MRRNGWLAAGAAVLVLAASAVTVRAAASTREGWISPLERDSTPAYPQQQLQRDLDAVRDGGAVGALAMVDLDGERLAATSGTGDLTAQRPVVTGGYFRMGSNTKTFVAVALLQLVGEGALSLDDTVERWLPGVVTGNGNDGAAITVRQLLQHTSGLYSYTDDLPMVASAEDFQRHRFDSFTPRELVAMAVQHPPSFAPGHGWEYSNTNYVLAGMIIEAVTGTAWGEVVRERITGPLGMRHTFDPGDDADLPQPHATGYMYYTPDDPIDATRFNVTWAGAAGALVTTAEDLTRFWRAIGDGTLLKPEQRTEMLRTVAIGDTPAGPDGYGLGIGWQPLDCGGGFWYHNGSLQGYTTLNGVSEDGRRSVVVSVSTVGLEKAIAAADTLVAHVMCAR